MVISRMTPHADAKELKRLRELTQCQVTLSGGLVVYGTIEAAMATQKLILENERQRRVERQNT